MCSNELLTLILYELLTLIPNPVQKEAQSGGEK